MRRTWLKQRRDQVLNLHAPALLHIGDDARAVAGLGIAAVAEQRDALARLDQRCQLGELGLRLGTLDVLVEDLPERVGIAGARGGAALCRRAELLQMQIADAGLVERRGEL